MVVTLDSRYTSTQALQDEKDRAAEALNNAEVHLHAAHQSEVGKWIRAAADRLHDAIARYDAALAAIAVAMTPLAA